MILLEKEKFLFQFFKPFCHKKTYINSTWLLFLNIAKSKHNYACQDCVPHFYLLLVGFFTDTLPTSITPCNCVYTCPPCLYHTVLCIVCSQLCLWLRLLLTSVLCVYEWHKYLHLWAWQLRYGRRWQRDRLLMNPAYVCDAQKRS